MRGHIRRDPRDVQVAHVLHGDDVDHVLELGRRKGRVIPPRDRHVFVWNLRGEGREGESIVMYRFFRFFLKQVYN